MSVDIHQVPAYTDQPDGPIRVTASWRGLFYTTYFDDPPDQEQMDEFIDQAAKRLKDVDARWNNQIRE